MDKPVLPDYAGACIANIVPALLDGSVEPPAWIPAPAIDTGQVVLLVLDGLGWEQLQDRRHLAPTLCSMLGGPITSVSPTTTATALTSIATGLAPGQHGVMGYRVAVDHEVLNILRWSTPVGDARKRINPKAFQPNPAFCSQRPCIVTKAEFATSGFSGAHLAEVRFRGYRVPSTMVVELRNSLRAGEPFIYVYYDGIDKVAHEYGLGEHYDAELQAVDRLVADILGSLPRDAALVITADHGQVDVGDNLIDPHPDVMAHVSFQSGEGRFRWLHARPGREAAAGGRPGPPRRHRLGRVARPDGRRGLVGRPRDRCGPPAVGRRRPRGPPARVLPRCGRLGPVPADRPPRVAHCC
ncbi:alkaline phosphatase family protein [Aquihabitans daechungensis]|uniref:alkaline phosphatase family protein n=1 Tax=Aquihabitans daechungensis TaxID=1052257 RepID=UPI003BA33A85